jgi:glycine cleavage system transcriptional repressor
MTAVGGGGDVDRVALTAVGADRPGIVAALTGALEELGCNLEDSTMSILRGQFAVLLVLAVPDGLDAAGVEAALGPVAGRLDLVVVVRPVQVAGAARGPAGDDGEVYAFSVHGADRPGIVHRATDALGRAGANIVDLSTRLVGTDDEPVYVLTVTAAFAPGPDTGTSVDGVCRAVEAFGVRCHAHRVEIDVL